MKQHYALSLLAGLLASAAMAQPPCLVNFTTPAGQTSPSTWNPANVPPSLNGAVSTTTTAGSTTATVLSATGLGWAW